MGRNAETHIRVTEETWEQLNRKKGPGDSFEDVITGLLDEEEHGDHPAIGAVEADDSAPGDELVHVGGGDFEPGDTLTVNGEEHVVARTSDSGEAVAHPARADRLSALGDGDGSDDADDTPDDIHELVSGDALEASDN